MSHLVYWWVVIYQTSHSWDYIYCSKFILDLLVKLAASAHKSPFSLNNLSKFDICIFFKKHSKSLRIHQIQIFYAAILMNSSLFKIKTFSLSAACKPCLYFSHLSWVFVPIILCSSVFPLQYICLPCLFLAMLHIIAHDTILILISIASRLLLWHLYD